MQPNSMAQKVKVLFDGEEIPGLVKFPEVPLERQVIEVPTFSRTRKIQNGVTAMPEAELVYETRRDTKTRAFFRSWFDNNEKHDATVIYCDADGAEYGRELWQDVECRKISTAPVDFASVSYAQLTVTLLPYDIVQVASA